MNKQNEKQESSKPVATQSSVSSNIDQEKTWAILAHVGGLFFSFIAPLLIWLIFKDSSSFVDKHGKEALNFQISLIIYWVVSMFLMILLIGFVLMIALFIFEIVVIIKAAIAAGNKEEYRYPLSIRLI